MFTIVYYCACTFERVVLLSRFHSSLNKSIINTPLFPKYLKVMLWW